MKYLKTELTLKHGPVMSALIIRHVKDGRFTEDIVLQGAKDTIQKLYEKEMRNA